jgi:two-component sensor histidine kinase
MSRLGLARREASSNSGTRAAINDQVSLGARGGRKMWEHSMTDLALKSEVPMERVLLNELVHRINNEFASVISAVSRSAARSGNREVKVILAQIIELLSHYAEVHRALQMPEQDSYIDAAAYLDNLCLSISRSKLDHLNIDLVLVASPLRLQAGQCWRLGVIVYELVTNAAKHAFGNGKGQIRVELSRVRNLFECRVTDNGSAAARVQRGRGLKIVDELVKGLNGRLDQKFGRTGSLSILSFPHKGEPQPAGPEEKIGSGCHST